LLTVILRSAARFCMLAIVVSLPLAAFAQDTPAPSAVAETFLRASLAGDEEAAARLWSESAENRVRFERTMRRRQRLGCALRTIVDSAQAGETVVVGVSQLFEKGAATARFDCRLVLERGAWRVASCEDEDDLFAASLAAMPEPERWNALRSQPERIGASLIRAFIRRGIDIVNTSSAFADAHSLAAFALELSHCAGDRGGESLSLGLLGIVARLQGRLPEAQELTERELEIAREVRDADVLGRALLNMSRLDVRDPIEGKRKHEAHLRELINLGEQVTDEIVVVRALQQLSMLFKGRGDYMPARAFADESLRLAEVLGDPAGAYSAAMWIGTLYGDNHDYLLELQYLQQAETIARADHGRELALILTTEADTFDKLGQAAKRDALLKEAMAMVIASGDEVLKAKIDEMHAEFLLRQGSIDEAECRMRKAARIHRFENDPLIFFPYIKACLEHGDFRHALRLAHEQLAQVQAPAWDVLARTLEGQAYRGLGDRKRALASFLDAAATASAEYGTTVGEDERKIGWFKDGATAYRHAADLLLHDGRVEEAFHYADSAKGGLLASLIHHRDNVADDLSPAERLEEARLRKRVTELNVRSRVPAPASQRRGLEEEIRRARGDYASFRDGVQARHRRVRSGNEIVETPPLTAVAATLDRETAIVEYLVMDDHVDVFIVRRDVHGKPLMTTRNIRISRKDLSGRVADLRARISRRDFAFAGRAHELYELLLAPIREDIRSQQALCIIPDDVLWDVPFAALMNDRRYVIEDYIVTYAASAGVRVTTSAERSVARRSTTERRLEIGVFANPSLFDDDRKRVKAYYRNAEIGDLPDAEREAKVVGGIFPAGESGLYLAREATEARVKRDVNRFRVLHFAAHAIVDDATPMYSRILLSRTAGDGEDGFLEAQEISALPIDADLVVLSACDTARGEIAPGAGVVGLSWAFSVAGARSTMATQWPVSSPATADLMIDFYRAWRSQEGRKSAVALRAAQRELIRRAPYKHPFYWAAFVLFD